MCGNAVLFSITRRRRARPTLPGVNWPTSAGITAVAASRIFTSILNRMAKPVAKIEAVKEVTKQ
jgi:hypothetical protein